jgi:16S rRNA (cytidine1402-2'-O)-methyltransferase
MAVSGKKPGALRSRAQGETWSLGERNPGTLYVVSTPIGNLEDMTLRAIRVLKSVNLIAAEGVQHSRGLCRHYGIRTRLTAYNQHNRKAKGPELIRKLRSGWDIALVTNAGTPGISDPGARLVTQALEEQIRVSPIPGPSVVTAALSASGMRADRFVFVGFLSHSRGKRRKELETLSRERHSMVLMEAPHRLQATLTDLRDILGNRQTVLLRELTKVYEEVIRGSVTEILEGLQGGQIKGECTLVVSGQETVEKKKSPDEGVINKIRDLLTEGRMSTRDIAEKLSNEEGMNYREMYKLCLSMKKQM